MPTNPETISTKQARIANIARQRPNQALTPLSHHIELREAHRRTRKDAAPGIDAQTAADFERDLEANLQSLLDRAKSGTYRAPPVRRVNIPKGDGKTRPIGIPTHEDKVLQRAVVMVLEPVYEQEFYDFSFGFRPGRSAHAALETLWRGLMNLNIGWVLDGAAILAGVMGARGDRFEAEFESAKCSLYTPTTSCADLIADGRTANKLAIGGAIIAPLALGGGVVMLLVGARRRAPSRYALLPVLTTTYAGISLTWRTGK